MPSLITYRWIRDKETREHLGHKITFLDPIVWLAQRQDDPKTYFIVNTLEITPEQATEYDGAFYGM